MAECAGPEIWSPSKELSARVKKLREEYFSFHQRGFRNETMPFSTGEEQDILFSPHNWGVAPEVFILSRSFQDTLRSLAKKVELPAGFWAEPLVKRQALFFAEVVGKHLPVRILDGELIVGGQFNSSLSRCLNQRERREWERLERRWFRSNLFMNIFGIGNCGAVPGHLIPNYPKALKLGFRGLAEYFEKLKEKAASQEHKLFLDSLIIVCRAVKELAERYAAEAENLARDEKDPARCSELESIAKIMRKVPWNPPASFWEALQALWFTHMLVMTAESYPGPGLSPGRVDQYLYPYLQNDLASGKISREFAKELLRCWFIKHNYAYDFMGRTGSNQGINSGFGQLITLGGHGPEGEDLSNELTWLLLEVIEEMNLLEPKPNIRLHANTPEPLLSRVAELCQKTQGSPFLMNFDTISEKALANAGYPKHRLWDYAPVGCLENTLQGCERSGTVDVNLNFAKAVELALFNGRDLRLKLRLGPRTGNPEKFQSFDQFFMACKLQLRALIDRIVASACLADEIRSRFENTPYLSALIDGCAEKGKDVSAGGPEYNFITVEGVALATAVDSLAAIKALVFDEKRVSMAELRQAIRKNFQGYDILRQNLLSRAPKYGNDDDRADRIAFELNRFFAEEVFRRTSPATGRRFRAGYLSWNYWVLYATSTAATPDGRMRGTYLSNGLCPVTGVAHKGPTSIARSVAKLGLELVPNGGSLTLSFNPSIIKGEMGKRILSGFLRGFQREGGSALQVNIISPELLRDAQKNPEPYRNLLVRVTGYNAYFTALGKEIQDEIIAREALAAGEK